MPVVREELGPSLPQLLEPRWRVLSRGRRIAVVVAAVVLVALLVVAREAVRAEPLKPLVVREPIAFNLVHRPELRQVTPGRGEVLRLQADPASNTEELFTVSPLTVPPYRGDISSAYLLMASRKLDELRAADPNVAYRGEGKARVNLIPGYQLAYQTRKAGKLFFGKVFFLVAEPGNGQPQSREGAELTLLSQFSPATTPSLTDVGNTYLLKAPLRSFRFGTERP
ncbi:MAG: hypothetical protein JWO02_3337 [Solirubrobacterales bacterium]|nr:hypothetical protein [Solirubrobacterales bacterium]